MTDLAPIHLVVGHGGAGVSTVAAAAVVGPRRARGAASTMATSSSASLLVTLDRFHQAARLFGVFSRPGEPVPVTQHACLLELGGLDLVEILWERMVAAMASGLGELSDAVTGVDPAELLGMPGVEQFLVLRAVRDAATSGRWDKVILDCSGGIDPIALVQAPRMLADVVNRLWPRHRRLAAATENVQLARLATLIDGVVSECDDLTEVFTDPDGVAVHIVTTDTVYGTDMTHRYVSVLDLLGIPTATVTVNRAGPADSDHSPVDAADRYSRLAVGAHVVTTAELAESPRSVVALRSLDVRLIPSDRAVVPGPASAELDHLAGSGLRACYRLRWRQPLPDPADLRLGRSGDDLVVTVCGVRRRVALPSVLRRCVVAGARWDAGFLAIEFRPDPSLWPKHASAAGRDRVSDDDTTASAGER